MSFQILDYIHELEKYGEVINNPSWVLATCPICKGKLKISKNPYKYGAYACYTDNCHEKNKIRNLLYAPKPFQPSRAFKLKSKPIKRLSIIVKPKPINTSISNFLTDRTFIKPVQESSSNKVITYFNYDSFRVVRVDYIDSSGQHSKYIYPEYQLLNGHYIQGIPSKIPDIPLYNSSYLQDCMVFVEGEKVATIGQKLGLAAVTFPAFAFSEQHIAKYAGNLRAKGLTNVLYLADNDVPGKHKGELISHIFWDRDINTTVLNLTDLYTDYQDIAGFDLYDAYKYGLINKTNIVDELSRLVESR